MPRVAFLGYAHDARGGIAQFGRRLAETVGERATVRLVGYRKLYPGFTRPGRQQPDPSAARVAIPAVSLVVPWDPRTWRATARDLRAFRADLLVVQWWSPFFGPSVRAIVRRARRDGTRTLIMCHNDRPHEPLPFSRAITRSTLAQADVLAAFTDTVAQGVRAMVPGREVFVSPLPQALIARTAADADHWDARLGAPAAHTILFFGNVRAYKGLEDLVAALPLVRERLDARLVVAGTFMEPMERYVEQARTLGVEPHVAFIPDYVADEHVPGLFARCDVVALPYRTATGSAVLGEAAVAGKPVVVTDVGPLAQMVDGHGVLVPPRDPAGARGRPRPRAAGSPASPAGGRRGVVALARVRAAQRGSARVTSRRHKIIAAARRAGLEDVLRDVDALRSTAARRDRRDMRALRRLMALSLAEDACCVDVGANVGAVLRHMVEYAPRGHHVAFEPLPELAALLGREFPGVDVRNAAVSDAEGETTFYRVRGRDTRSSLSERDAPPDQVEPIAVALTSLDAALPDGYVPAFVKIDVEGAEEQVLRGAAETLARHRPTVAFEHDESSRHFGTTSATIVALLAGAGLRVFDMKGRGPYDGAALERAVDAGKTWTFVAHR